MPTLKASEFYNLFMQEFQGKNIRSQIGKEYDTHAGIILIRASDERILVVHECPRGDFVGNLYSVPKGQRNQCDSNLFETACRELYEETRINLVDLANCAALRYIPVDFVFYNKYWKYALILFPIIVDDAHCAINPSVGCDEVDNFAWFSIKEMWNLRVELPLFMRCLVSSFYDMCVNGMHILEL
jgi:8-oxo-dGTP pyrophosphatase MutT (NUDIX family)